MPFLGEPVRSVLLEADLDLVIGTLVVVLDSAGEMNGTSPLILPYLLKSYAVTLRSALSLSFTEAMSSGLTNT
jgi:hypothetical protein